MLLFASVKVPVVDVISRPLTDVARATPKVGLVIIGLVSVLLVNVSSLPKLQEFQIL